jgi:hypothetical protein
MSRIVSSSAARSVAMGYLRAFLTLLVIAHHAVLAYHAFAPPPPLAPNAEAWASLVWTAFPVVDAAKWRGVELLVAWDDTFFMSLFFFVSGLFVWPSLGRKGAARFARDRVRTLGGAFVASAGVLAPLAYVPSYLQSGAGSAGGGGFWSAWRSLPAWPAGPAWFLWVLLVLACVAAALTRVVPGWGEALGRAAGAVQRPIAFFAAIVAVTAIAYVPLAAQIDPLRWVSFGPFFLQASRALHYAAWFFAGAGVGAFGVDRGLLAPGGRLARRWPLWIVASLASFAVEMAVVVTILVGLEKGDAPSRALRTFADVGFIVTCAASCLALLAVFVRFARPSRVGDAVESCSFGMYLVHYPIVTWLQYALLGAPWSGAAKGSVAIAGAAVGSFVITAVVRRAFALAAVRRTAGSAASMEGA